jgi:hypothetical protein
VESHGSSRDDHLIRILVFSSLVDGGRMGLNVWVLFFAQFQVDFLGVLFLPSLFFLLGFLYRSFL